MTLYMYKGHLSVFCQNFQTTCPLKLLGEFQLDFIFSLQANGERKFIYIWSVTHDEDGPSFTYIW